MAKSDIRLKNVNLSHLARYFLGAFLLLMAIAGVTLTVIYRIKIQNELNTRKALEISYEEPLTELIGNRFETVVSDLMILSESSAVRHVADDTPGSLERAGRFFSSFSGNKQMYDQIRLLDERGMEVVRVDLIRETPVFLPGEQLQDKSERYYFRDTFKLGRGEVFISPLDLNVEGGRIERPLKPMIRFGTPVFDGQGRKKGVVVINYMAASLLRILDNVYSYPFSYSMLLNPQGYFLKGRNPEEEWGFMFEDRAHLTFGNAFPEAWKEISRVDSGQFQDSNGLFTFVTVYPLKEGWNSSTGSRQAFAPSTDRVTQDSYYMKIVLYVSPRLLSRISNSIRHELFLWYVGLAGLLSIIAFMAGYTITVRRSSAEQIKVKNIELEKLSAKLSKYLPPQVYDSIFSGKKEVCVGAERKSLTVFFSDIKDFTALTDSLEPERLSSLLNDYFNEMSLIAMRYGGTVDKFVGDAVMVFFGDPETKGEREDAFACVSMAIDMQAHVKRIRKQWEGFGISKPLRIRAGINSGFCTVGNFGSENRLDYTIVGGPVNLASRLEAHAEPDQILISRDTYALVKDSVLCDEKGEIRVKGIARPVQCYQVLALRESMQGKQRLLKHEHEGISVKIDLAVTGKDQAIKSLKELISKLS